MHTDAEPMGGSLYEQNLHLTASLHHLFVHY